MYKKKIPKMTKAKTQKDQQYITNRNKQRK